MILKLEDLSDAPRKAAGLTSCAVKRCTSCFNRAFSSWRAPSLPRACWAEPSLEASAGTRTALSTGSPDNSAQSN